MKTIKEIYDNYMTKEIAQKILNSARDCKSILIQRRHDLVDKDMMTSTFDTVLKSIDFWDDIINQYEEFLEIK